MNMGKMGRKIEKAILKKKVKDLQTGTDALKRFLDGPGEVKSLSQAMTLLNEVRDAMAECRDAAVTAVQHVGLLERELQKEQYIRQEMIYRITRDMATLVPESTSWDTLEERLGDAWDKAHPSPLALLVEGGETRDAGA